MSTSTLHDRLESVFRQVLNQDDITLTDETTAADIEGWDSLAHISLMYTIEEEFGIEFGTDEFAQFTNVGDLKQSLVAKGCG